MKKHQLTKAAFTLFAASLVFGNPVWAETGGAAGKTTSSNVTIAAATSAKQRFPDVAPTHWANKYITRLALLGIVEGNERGLYEPEASVTQEQVITMAVRMLGLENEAKQLNVSSYVLPFDVSNYAKPYVVLALEKGLITAQEETEIAASGTGKWGARQASREWVAKLSVRTIGKQPEAEELKNRTSSFKDHSSISSWAVGYINEAVELKIVDGMEDGTFRPQNPVTRAQMAAFLSRAGNYTAEQDGKSAVGVVESIDSASLTIVDDYGERSSYTLSNDTVFFGLGSGTSSQAGVIQPDNKVYLIVSEDRAAYVEVLEEHAKVSETLEGVLVSVNAADATMTLKAGGSEVLVDLLIPPTVVGLDGRGVTLSDLEPGWTLELKRTGSRAKYSTVTVKHIPLNKNAEGIVQSLDLTERKLYVLENETGNSVYPLADTFTYVVDGEQGDINTIKAKDVIGYHITNDQVTHIEMIKAYEEPQDSGRLVEFRLDKNLSYITLQKADNQYATYAIADGAEVVIPGMDFAVLNDLTSGDQLKVLLNDNNEAYQISVTNRSMQTEYWNTVISYDEASKALTVKNASGQLAVYELNDKTKFNISGSDIPFDSAETFLIKGKKLDITASSESNVKEVRIVYGYEGVIAQADAANGELTLKVGGKLLTLPVLSNVSVELTNKTNGSLAELKAGDRVKAGLDSAQENVKRIQVIKTEAYTLTDVNAASRQLSLKDDAGGFHNLALLSGMKIYNQNQAEIAIGDLVPDDPIFVTYIGTAVDKVTVPSVTRGKVTAVDAAGGKVTLTDSAGAAQTVTVGSGVKVKKDGASAAFSLADIKSGDRIDVVKDPSGIYKVTVAQTVQKKVYYYDGLAKALFVYRELLTEQPSYVFHAQAYVHKGSEIIAPGNLATNDTVNLYIVNGKIIELEKL